MKLLTNLRVGVERFDMYNVADSTSDNDHLPTISLAHTYNGTQTPVGEICITLLGREQQKVVSSFITSL